MDNQIADTTSLRALAERVSTEMVQKMCGSCPTTDEEALALIKSQITSFALVGSSSNEGGTQCDTMAVYSLCNMYLHLRQVNNAPIIVAVAKIVEAIFAAACTKEQMQHFHGDNS